MALVIPEELKAKAEVWYGDEKGQERISFFLREVDMPNGLLSVKDIIECGYVKECGFVWVKQKNKSEHKFEKIGRLVSYATEISAYVEKHKIRKLTGVKVKELLLWVNLVEIYADDLRPDRITFKIIGGLSKTFPASAFVIETKEMKEHREVEKPKEIKEAIAVEE
ncbi:hypothetical protein Scep_008827 [Stephania cephalantha]|uniref:Uncharacterized protein n=1 Tax=Stephania cephalantha TaxID=152367 RepID=A0AAP0JRY0_9MAGN